jgi:hypothetical protein
MRINGLHAQKTGSHSVLMVMSLSAAACGALVGIDSDLRVKPSPGDPVEPTTDPGSGDDRQDAGVAIPVDAAHPNHGYGGDSSTPAPQAPQASRPPEGTYTYQATSGDNDTASGWLIAYSPYGTVTVTVTYDGPNCFNQVATYRTAYTEQMHFCVRGPELVEDSETRHEVFFALIAVEAWTAETCSGEDGGTPGDVYFSMVAKPVASSWMHHLTGSVKDSTFGAYAFKADGTYTYQGDETLGALGNSKHYYDSRIISGAQVNGSDIVDWYFSPVDGTLLRFTRTLELQYPWGTGVNYHEHVDMTLIARPDGDAGVH